MSDLICKPFERTDEVHILKDAICLTQSEWDTVTPEEVTAMEDARWVKWLAIVNAPPVDILPDEPQLEM